MELETEIVNATRDILKDAADHSLRAVELANTLRARCGTEVGGASPGAHTLAFRMYNETFTHLQSHISTLQALLMVRNKCGGLLVSKGLSRRDP